MLQTEVRSLLDSRRVAYRTIPHERFLTAQEIAAAAHIPGREMAKTVMVKLDGELAMAVLPAHERVDLGRLRQVAGANEVTLALESEFKDRFPGCETGAMPPFGNLYGMRVFVAEHLAEDQAIAFNCGDHRELVQMRYRDFAGIVQPRVGDIVIH